MTRAALAILATAALLLGGCTGDDPDAAPPPGDPTATAVAHEGDPTTVPDDPSLDAAAEIIPTSVP